MKRVSEPYRSEVVGGKGSVFYRAHSYHTKVPPEGIVRMNIAPEVAEGVPQSLTQKGSWTIVSGTGAFEGLRASGEMEVVYDPDPSAPARGRYAGTVAH